MRFINRKHGFEDLLGGVGPHERFWDFVPIGDPGADVAFEGVHAAVVAAFEVDLGSLACTIRESTLSADTKTAPTREMARIHPSVNQVPSTDVNVAFHELSADSVYTDGVPSSPAHACEAFGPKYEVQGYGPTLNLAMYLNVALAVGNCEFAEVTIARPSG